MYYTTLRLNRKLIAKSEKMLLQILIPISKYEFLIGRERTIYLSALETIWYVVPIKETRHRFTKKEKMV